MEKEDQHKKASREATTQQKRLKNGRGSGHHRQYTPFIQIERAGFQSRGRSHYIFDERQERSYHLLSDLELLIYIWAWSCAALDIREQYPLQLSEFESEFSNYIHKMERGTVAIANKLGIKHPMIDRSTPRIMTTDFLVSFPDSKIAIHGKYQAELKNGNHRKQELRHLEKRYWQSRGVKFIVMTEKPFTYLVAEQMMWAIDGMKWKGTEDQKEKFLKILDKTSRMTRMHERLNQCAHAICKTYEETVQLFKYTVLTRQWRIKNKEQELDLSIKWDGRRTGRTNSNLIYPTKTGVA